MRCARKILLVASVLAWPVTAVAQQLNPAPDRRPGEGDGPFERLIIRGAILIDGTGAPPRGPVDIVIEGNRIARIASVGVPHVPIDSTDRPKDATREIDASGWYVLPGFVDLHEHVGGAPKSPDAEYAFKLWLAHGITTIRGVPAGPFDWSLNEKARSARNEIVAPRLFNYHRLGTGEGWEGGAIRSGDDARAWVRWAARKGIDGLKLGSHRPEIMAAAIDEAKKLGLGTTAHLAQTGVAHMNAIDAVRLGLGTVTHFYGIFESLYDDHDVQPWPVDMNYNDEQARFGQVARQWNLIHPQGSPEWKALLEEFLEHRVILDPTMATYSAGRDLMRARNADWNRYVLPTLWEFYQPSRESHGSYWYDWTTADEIAWQNFYRVWMALIDDYKDMGGRVTVSSDAAFIYNLWGFGSIHEMEMLQEAGFHPLEVIRAATMHGAEGIFEPKGQPIEFGVVREGLLADLVLIEENPLANLKVLYGTGWQRLNDETGEVEWVGGVRYTIKDGIVYDAKALLADVERMVEAQKASTTEDSATGARPRSR
ncbi:MAG TPA: amidohydrolase family protein [Gemmatimonadales bacterium]